MPSNVRFHDGMNERSYCCRLIWNQLNCLFFLPLKLIHDFHFFLVHLLKENNYWTKSNCDETFCTWMDFGVNMWHHAQHNFLLFILHPVCCYSLRWVKCLATRKIYLKYLQNNSKDFDAAKFLFWICKSVKFRWKIPFYTFAMNF